VQPASPRVRPRCPGRTTTPSTAPCISSWIPARRPRRGGLQRHRVVEVVAPAFRKRSQVLTPFVSSALTLAQDTLQPAGMGSFSASVSM
jgi:hypothetical protein